MQVYEHEIGIAEYILSAMLQWVIGFPDWMRPCAVPKWYGSTFRDRGTYELYGKTVASLAMAAIGREVARRARVFGMKVLGLQPHSPAAPTVRGAVDGMDRLRGVVWSISLFCLPLEPSTAGVIGTQQLARMKRAR